MFGLVRCLMLGAVLLSVEKNGVELKVESETTQIDPARSVFLTMTMTAGQGVKVVRQLDELCAMSGIKRSEFFINAICAEYDKVNGNPQLKKMLEQMKQIAETMKQMNGQVTGSGVTAVTGNGGEGEA